MGNKQSVKSHLENSQRTGVFQLTKAKLNEIPPDVFRVTTLRTIDLSTNHLKTIPITIANFTNLRTLILNENLLTQLPEEICRLAKLETLSLAGNQLHTLPTKLGDLRSLRSINLSNNRLQKFPIQLRTIRQLDFIDLSKNKITEIPDGVGELQAHEINLNQNQLSKISDDLARCPRLKVLRLEENCLRLDEITRSLLTESQISLLAVDGNLFDMKQLQDHPSYDQYMERYTATKKKI
ncbi:Leucine-rich repeat-containing protein 57 [Dermatophagoides farinae]|uniref:Leucine-rich repeat-containing protein 17 n=1 Tax=Dermatophagoides farinae TaxID=6954 RepID=A0A922I438_DERFA|nr:leucine-rich repeat-containing protein 57-like [Dermatophagoides farinae]KAH7646535.1 leucine-rich repeat-containing protein 17 [Dermatophagoides farinae]KAH9517040.1 Leucine-rich repeat-containing protein 57 [Dermatophagoides farinae]